MGNYIGLHISNSSDDSGNGSCNISEVSLDSGDIVEDSNMTTEPKNYNSKLLDKAIEKNINYDRVIKLEKNLDVYETVSLVFLLYDSPDLALTKITNALTNCMYNVISDWAKDNPPKWKGKLIEALSIIQNYEELAELGYDKSDIDSYFYPYLKDKSVYINKIRKVLYMFCESLTAKDCKDFMSYVKLDNNVIVPCKYNEIHLEMYLLSLMNQGHIYTGDEELINLNYLTSKLKAKNYLHKVDEIENVMNKENEERKLNVASKIRVEKKCNKENITKAEEDYDDSGKMYPINDPKNVGLCIIINQRDFYKDEDAPNAEQLDRRDGTDIDCYNLRKTLEQFNIKVYVKENMSHDKLKSEIIKTVNEKVTENHSMFVLCILSHGIEGAVYGSNGVIVNTESIIHWLTDDCARKLCGKPKVLIIQACQGKNLQNIDENITPDAPCSKLCDVLVCHAVVPGYVALRDKKNGTVYIQVLCEMLEKWGHKKDFVYIMTRVNNKVNQLHHHRFGSMTPRFDSRLTKELYLVPKQVNS